MTVQQWKKIIGFFVIISIIVLLLQLSSMVAKKSQNQTEMLETGKGTTFMPPPEPPVKRDRQNLKPEPQVLPEKTITKKVPAELSEPERKSASKKELPTENKKQADKQLAKSDKVDSANQKKTNDPSFSKPKQHQRNDSQKDRGDRETSSSRMVKNGFSKRKKVKQSSNKKGVQTISMSDAQFLSLDIKRDELIENSKQGRKKEGLYGWGILSDYKNPDIAHRLLGGIPFAIDVSAKQYYKINLLEKSAQPAFAMSAYGATGVEANDPQLPHIVKQAFHQGTVKKTPQQLSYFYLFSLDTETYINSKVVNAFEWYLTNVKNNAIEPESFREKARLRIGVWQAKRQSGGQMGIVIPVYFDYQNKHLFFPTSYYQYDYEAVRLNIKINKSEYQ